MAEELNGGKKLRLVIEYDPARDKIAHQIDDGFPANLLVNELHLILAEATSIQLMARARQQAQQRAGGIEIARQGQVPPAPRRP